MERIREHEFLQYALRGNVPAIEFCQLIGRISQTWDDLVDGDKPVDAQAINRMMFAALIELPENTFYQQHAFTLVPIIRSHIADWMAANALEYQGIEAQRIAFVIRDNVGAIVTQCAYLIGGYEWMCEVNVAVRRHVHDEPFDEYRSNFGSKNP